MVHIQRFSWSSRFGCFEEEWPIGSLPTSGFTPETPGRLPGTDKVHISYNKVRDPLIAYGNALVTLVTFGISNV